MIKNNSFHFSVDDVFSSLIEVTDKNIKIQNHWFFKQLYNLWIKYKIKTSCNLFYEGKLNGKLRKLDEIKSIKKQIKNGWISFGPHALNEKTPPFTQNKKKQKEIFNKIYKEIIRFAGKKNLANYTRLHYYSESYELSNYWKSKGVKALFTTDRSIGSHRMPKKISKELLKKGYVKYKNFFFLRTDFRVEWLSKIKKRKNLKIENIFREKIKEKNFIVIYSHEYELKYKKNRECLIKSAEILTKNMGLKCVKP